MAEGEDAPGSDPAAHAAAFHCFLRLTPPASKPLPLLASATSSLAPT